MKAEFFLLFFGRLLLHSMQYEDLTQLCNDPRARTAVLASMDALGKEAQVNLSQAILPEIIIFRLQGLL